MNATPDMTLLEREQLKRRANQIRSRLLRTVERLDQKRQNLTKLTDVKYQLESHVVPLAAGAAIAMVAVGALTTLAAVHAFTAPSRLRAERARALKRAWRHPERVGQKSKGSIVLGFGRTLIEGLVTTAAIELIKRAMTSPPSAAPRVLSVAPRPPIRPEPETLNFDALLPAAAATGAPRPPRE